MTRGGKKKRRRLVLATGYHVRARPLWDGRVDTGDVKLKVIPQNYFCAFIEKEEFSSW